MTFNQLKEFLLWCVALNYAILLLWFGVFMLAHDWLFNLHARWFVLSPEVFDAVHYAGMAVYKVGIILLNLVPVIGLSICSRGK